MTWARGGRSSQFYHHFIISFCTSIIYFIHSKRKKWIRKIRLKIQFNWYLWIAYFEPHICKEEKSAFCPLFFVFVKKIKKGFGLMKKAKLEDISYNTIDSTQKVEKDLFYKVIPLVRLFFQSALFRNGGSIILWSDFGPFTFTFTLLFLAYDLNLFQVATNFWFDFDFVY